MPEGKGMKSYTKHHYGSTPSKKPMMGNYGGGFGSTPSSDAGASGRSYVTGKPRRNPKQKSMPTRGGAHKNLVRPGDPGNKGY